VADFIVDLFCSLDGYGTGPVGYWGKGGPELDAERARALGDPEQTLVFGANTYRLMQRFHAESTDADASLLNKARKVVISGTLEAPLTWENSTLVPGDAVDVVPRLKAESPVPLRCHGSISMNRALLAAGLVDRLELTVFPVITGESGRNPVLAGLPDIDLELVGSRTLDGRIQQLVYLPRGPWLPTALDATVGTR
jgi:dihydrofolate reductase